MQCPIYGCIMSPKFLFLLVGYLGVAMGMFSAWAPKRSIALYQKIMALFNWNVAPIDLPREIRNTQLLGLVLTTLSAAILVIVSRRF